MPNDEVKLSGCPFCGKGDFVRVRRYEFPADEEGPAWKWGYHVICDAAGIAGTRGCGCSSGWAETAPEAITAWNRRAIPSTVSGETEAAYLEALTPSAGTKAAYIGEFTIAVERFLNEDDEPDDDDGPVDPYDHIQVPWTTIKQIMAAIRARAEASPIPAETQAVEVGATDTDRSHYDRDGYCDNPARGYR